MDLQTFFESAAGQISIAAAIVIVLCIAAMTSKGKKIDTKALTYAAISIALSFVISTISSMIPFLRLPQGGSVTLCSMLIIVLVGYFFGARTGILAGVALGLLDMLINPYIISPIQALLDYPLAYGCLGLGGLFFKKENSLIPAYLIGVFGRFVCSFLSGVIFFASYAPVGQSVYLYSAGYNGSFMGAEAALSIIIISIPAVKSLIKRYRDKFAPQRSEIEGSQGTN